MTPLTRRPSTNRELDVSVTGDVHFASGQALNRNFSYRQ